jgi:hypothetical protein
MNRGERGERGEAGRLPPFFTAAPAAPAAVQSRRNCLQISQPTGKAFPLDCTLSTAH